jgi:uncharacterized membrane protein
MPEIVAIAYQDQTVAERAAEELRRCGAGLLIDPDAFSVIVCQRDGGCQSTTNHQATATSQWSELWGALLDALLGDGESAAIDATSRERLRARLWPGSSALLLAVPRGGKQRALHALSHFDGQALDVLLTARVRERFDARDPRPGR